MPHGGCAQRSPLRAHQPSHSWRAQPPLYRQSLRSHIRPAAPLDARRPAELGQQLGDGVAEPAPATPPRSSPPATCTPPWTGRPRRPTTPTARPTSPPTSEHLLDYEVNDKAPLGARRTPSCYRWLSRDPRRDPCPLAGVQRAAAGGGETCYRGKGQAKSGPRAASWSVEATETLHAGRNTLFEGW